VAYIKRNSAKEEIELEIKVSNYLRGVKKKEKFVFPLQARCGPEGG